VDGLKSAVTRAERQRKKERAQQRAARRAERAAAARGRAAAEGFSNFEEVEVGDDDGGGKTVKIGLPAQQLTRRLLELSCDWPKRVGNLIFAEAPGPAPLYLETAPELFAWVSGFLPGEGPNRLEWAQGDDKVSEAGSTHT
jgi:hypothetical protein